MPIKQSSAIGTNFSCTSLDRRSCRRRAKQRRAPRIKCIQHSQVAFLHSALQLLHVWNVAGSGNHVGMRPGRSAALLQQFNRCLSRLVDLRKGSSTRSQTGRCSRHFHVPRRCVHIGIVVKGSSGSGAHGSGRSNSRALALCHAGSTRSSCTEVLMSRVAFGSASPPYSLLPLLRRFYLRSHRAPGRPVVHYPLRFCGRPEVPS